MIARLTAVGLLTAATALGCACSAHASPIRPDPGTKHARQADSAALLLHLRDEYAHSRQLRTHNGIVLVLNNPASAFL